MSFLVKRKSPTENVENLSHFKTEKCPRLTTSVAVQTTSQSEVSAVRKRSESKLVKFKRISENAEKRERPRRTRSAEGRGNKKESDCPNRSKSADRIELG